MSKKTRKMRVFLTKFNMNGFSIYLENKESNYKIVKNLILCLLRKNSYCYFKLFREDSELSFSTLNTKNSKKI